MSLTAIRAAIKAKLQGVSEIGQVHDYERFARSEAEFKTLYAATVGGVQRIRGWFLYRESTTRRDSDLGASRRLHAWRIVGFLSLDDADATGKTIDTLVESIDSAFAADRTLGGACLECKDLDRGDGPAGIQVERIDIVMFLSTLCHRAQLRLITEELVSP